MLEDGSASIPWLEILEYACTVDLLGRAGKLDEACDFIERMPLGSNAAISGALLGACRIHLNVDITEIAARALFDLDPGNQGDTSSCTTLPIQWEKRRSLYNYNSNEERRG